MTIRKQKDNESDAEYELYREVCRKRQRTYQKDYRDFNQDKVKAYREANKDKKKAYDQTYMVKRRYGLTPDEYTELTKNGCQVCGSLEKLCVDHCHTSLKVRGCLCNSCNSALGYMKDSPELLRKLTYYIEVHQ